MVSDQDVSKDIVVVRSGQELLDLKMLLCRSLQVRRWNKGLVKNPYWFGTIDMETERCNGEPCVEGGVDDDQLVTCSSPCKLYRDKIG
jgi:hypothetical protein